MQDPCLESYLAALDLTESMIRMADSNEARCDDDGSLLVNAVIRDAAYKIRLVAEKEYRHLNNQADETLQQVKKGVMPPMPGSGKVRRGRDAQHFWYIFSQMLISIFFHSRRC